MIFDIRDVKCEHCNLWFNSKDIAWYGYWKRNGIHVCSFCKDRLKEV